MNSTQLTCFIEVAENLNFAKAAQLLNLTQPAVTKNIQSLEQELGVILFERNTRNVAFTYAGREFYPNVKSILSQMQNVASNLIRLKEVEQNLVVIGTYNNKEYDYLHKVLQTMLVQNAQIRIDIVEASFEVLHTSLEAKSVDLILGMQEMANMQGRKPDSFHILAEAPVKCVMGTLIKTKNLSEFSLELFTKQMEEQYGLTERLTCAKLEKFWEQYPNMKKLLIQSANHTLMCSSVEAAVCLAKAGRGYLFLPVLELLEKSGLMYISVPKAPILHYGYFYLKSRHHATLDLLQKELQRYFSITKNE